MIECHLLIVSTTAFVGISDPLNRTFLGDLKPKTKVGPAVPSLKPAGQLDTTKANDTHIIHIHQLGYVGSSHPKISNIQKNNQYPPCIIILASITVLHLKYYQVCIYFLVSTFETIVHAYLTSSNKHKLKNFSLLLENASY